MLFREPPRTQFDLNFSLFRFPVRVHPLFWLIGVLLGANLVRQGGNGALLLVWIAVVFISILVHEFGHALAMRYYGQNARIVLYMLGGLAIPESSPYSTGMGRQASNGWNHIVVSAAGPAAGFVLALVVIGVIFLSGGKVLFNPGFPNFWQVELGRPITTESMRTLWFLADSLLFINILWGMVNLLPIFPLDGGQISRELCIMRDSYTGVVRSVWISFIAALGMIVVALYMKDLFIGLLFGSLAYSSYMMLQQLRGGGGYGGGGFGGGGGGYGGGGGRPW